MIHAVIFANRKHGNQLYDRTPNFPADAAAKIYELCISQSIPDALNDASPVLRYQPLDSHFLLSVIHRMPRGNAFEARAHVICVNFLMDAAEADRFFRIPFLQAADAVKDTAQKLLELQTDVLPRSTCGEFLRLSPAEAMPCRGKTPLAILMMGACHSLERKRTKQLYLQSGCSAEEELNNLLRVLPPPLRKQLSFHTGCVSARECRNLGICYCHERFLRNIVASDFEGGPRAAKYWYFADESGQESKLDEQNRTLVNRLIQIPERLPLYDLLRDAITDWDVYRELSLLVSDHPKLEMVLQQLPEEEVLRVIRSGSADELQLVQLAKAAGAGSAIRKAAKAARSSTPQTAPQSAPRASVTGLLRSTKRLLHQNRQRIMLLLSLSVAVLNYGAVSNGIGDELVRELLCFAGIACSGFFIRSLWTPETQPDPDKNP